MTKEKKRFRKASAGVTWLVFAIVFGLLGIASLAFGIGIAGIAMLFTTGVMIWAYVHFHNMPYIEIFFGDLLVNPYRVRQKRIHLKDVTGVRILSNSVEIQRAVDPTFVLSMSGLRQEDRRELISILQATQLD
jgi:hypothetical protein